ncbi:hypothetical protein Baya_16249 [Bagarius yarrelli]|uniref:Uncharacterized protein n=1 Tax=Bagarius yarrelli TaxID=175774 RepID=A0A556VUU5_BAGYA|nr:hypothetical protein Baya_16249 [Bagarius yarrelli]
MSACRLIVLSVMVVVLLSAVTLTEGLKPREEKMVCAKPTDAWVKELSIIKLLDNKSGIQGPM